MAGLGNAAGWDEGDPCDGGLKWLMFWRRGGTLESVLPRPWLESW